MPTRVKRIEELRESRKPRGRNNTHKRQAATTTSAQRRISAKSVILHADASPNSAVHLIAPETPKYTTKPIPTDVRRMIQRFRDACFIEFSPPPAGDSTVPDPTRIEADTSIIGVRQKGAAL